LLVAAVVALIVVGTSFPAAALLSQHRQVASATAQLNQLRHQNLLLTEQQQQLNSKTEIGRLAREEYQLVSPGQSLYSVLPSNAASTSSTATQDTGSLPVVSPADAPDMSPDPGLPQVGSTGSSGTKTVEGGSGTGSTANTSSTGGADSSGGHAGGYWARVASTLEFWK
jgi:cell division protein FtsB